MNAVDVAVALGVGSGRGARTMARLVAPGDKVVALSEAIARALEKSGHRPLRVQLSGARLPLADRAVDALCAPAPAAAELPATLKECARVVRPGGRILLATAAGLVERGPERHLLTALFMHAGLIDIEQRLLLGTAITTGRVYRG